MVKLDLVQFASNGIFSEGRFLEKVEQFDWSALTNKTVLVKGCGTTIIPPWVFMIVTARLIDHARTIHYGNEHSAVDIFRKKSEKTADVDG